MAEGPSWVVAAVPTKDPVDRMPLLTNPMVQQYLAQHNPLANGELRASGMVAPISIPDVVRTPGTLESNPMFRLGDATGGILENRKLLEPVGRYAQALGSLRGPGGAAVLSALLGAAGGAGFGLTTRRDPLLWGAIGAGAGALGGIGINQLLRRRAAKRRALADQWFKTAFYVSNEQDPMQYIQARLFEDGSIPSSDKSQMLSQLRSVPRSELVTLADLLKMAGGAAAGYIIGRFLMRFGGFGQAVMSGLGGLLGARMGGGSRNTFGLDADPSKDFFGRPRFVM